MEGYETIADDLLAKDVVNHGPVEEEFGREAWKRRQSEFINAFSDLEWNVDSTLADGDIAAIRYTVKGTHTACLENIERIRPGNSCGTLYGDPRHGLIAKGHFVEHCTGKQLHNLRHYPDQSPPLVTVGIIGSSPATRTDPFQGVYGPPSRCSELLFPTPVRPTSATFSPRCFTRDNVYRSHPHHSEATSSIFTSSQ